MSKSNRSRTRARRSARTGSLELFVRPQRGLPALVFGVLWRWRIELILTVTLIVAWVWLAEHVTGWTAGAVLAGVIGLVLAVPASRRFVLRRVWCVISRHRVRKCFVQARVMTHEGLLPLFIWTRPTPVGERLRLWLRPGLSAADVELAAGRIAAACWARDARIEVNPNRVSTVWVHVIRRDPLSSTHGITSPLLDGVPDGESDQDADVVPLPDRTTLTPPAAGQDTGTGAVTVTPISSATARKARATTRTNGHHDHATEHTSAAVVGRSGEDVSDYV